MKKAIFTVHNKCIDAGQGFVLKGNFGSHVIQKFDPVYSNRRLLKASLSKVYQTVSGLAQPFAANMITLTTVISCLLLSGLNFCPR